MTLDMNKIRNAFAEKILANDGDKGSMDAALYHVAKIAFEQGRAAGGSVPEGWQAALSAKSVPDGYALVPVKPTEDMLAAAARHYESDSYTGVTSIYQVMLAATPQVTTDDGRVRELEAKYNELIMAVARKFPNESRHETALRYINEAESVNENSSKPSLQMSGE